MQPELMLDLIDPQRWKNARADQKNLSFPKWFTWRLGEYALVSEPVPRDLEADTVTTTQPHLVCARTKFPNSS